MNPAALDGASCRFHERVVHADGGHFDFEALTIIDTEKFSASLRSRGVKHDQRQVLVTKFSGSEQEKDLSQPANCGGFGRIHHFYRNQGPDWPDNPLPIDPVTHALGLPHADSIKAQVFQNAICSWRCWYCFVDFDLLSANLSHSEFKTANELLDLYLAEPERPLLIDPERLWLGCD